MLLDLRSLYEIPAHTESVDVIFDEISLLTFDETISIAVVEIESVNFESRIVAVVELSRQLTLRTNFPSQETFKTEI